MTLFGIRKNHRTEAALGTQVYPKRVRIKQGTSVGTGVIYAGVYICEGS